MRHLLVCRMCRVLHRPRSIPNPEMADKGTNAHQSPIAHHLVPPFSKCDGARSLSHQNAIPQVSRQTVPQPVSETRMSMQFQATEQASVAPAAGFRQPPLDTLRFCLTPSHPAVGLLNRPAVEHAPQVARRHPPEHRSGPCSQNRDQGGEMACRADDPPLTPRPV